MDRQRHVTQISQTCEHSNCTISLRKEFLSPNMVNSTLYSSSSCEIRKTLNYLKDRSAQGLAGGKDILTSSPAVISAADAVVNCVEARVYSISHDRWWGLLLKIRRGASAIHLPVLRSCFLMGVIPDCNKCRCVRAGVFLMFGFCNVRRMNPYTRTSCHHLVRSTIKVSK